MNKLILGINNIKLSVMSGLPKAPPLPSTGNADLDGTYTKAMAILFNTSIVLSIGTFMMLGAMFLFPSKVQNAKDQSTWTLVGTIMIFSAANMVTFLSNMKLL